MTLKPLLYHRWWYRHNVLLLLLMCSLMMMMVTLLSAVGDGAVDGVVGAVFAVSAAPAVVAGTMWPIH